MVKRTFLKSTGVLLLALAFAQAYSQEIRINELMSANAATTYDEDGEASDWLELYNYGSDTINLENFGLSDKKEGDFWTLPAYKLAGESALLIFASDKDRKNPYYHWATLIDEGDDWSYLIPTSQPVGDWRQPAYNDSNWPVGKSGFGFGDDDDTTIVENARTILARKSFLVNDLSVIQKLSLHIDYDDAFVAYLNGAEVARKNITSDGAPAFDAFADTDSHEAQLVNGMQPENFAIDPAHLVEGENWLAIEVHNGDDESTDLTLIPFLSIGSLSELPGSVSDRLEINQGGFHTNFKLSQDGETVYLRNPEGIVIDSAFTGGARADISFGRAGSVPDSWVFFDNPTPGKKNSSNGKSRFSSPVNFSKDGGFYSQSLTLHISAAANAEIYYTTDGSIPTSADNHYLEPIRLNTTAVVRAVAIEPGAIASQPVTKSYLVNTHHDLAVISITTDPKNLWDEKTGIFTSGANASREIPYFGANFWKDWERPIHIELYESNGELAFSEDAGAQIFGGWSRANAQKSLAIHFREQYGAKEIEYPIFEGLEIDKFSALVLRNSGNDWLRTSFRDAFCTSLFHPSIDKQAYRPAVLYLNGEYWGIQNIREKVNEDFLATHHDIDPDDINLMEASADPFVEGSGEDYWALLGYLEDHSLAIQSNFDYVSTKIDVKNYMHYFVSNIIIDNQDWPGHNIKWWRPNGDTTRWRWITYDTDYSMGIYDGNRVTANSILDALATDGPEWPNPPWSTLTLRRLIENEGFKQDFINAIADQLNTNFLPEHTNAVITEMANTIEPEVQAHMNRWGSTYSIWLNEVERLKHFAANRAQYVRSHIQSTFNTGPIRQVKIKVIGNGGTVRVNTIELNGFPWTGDYFQGNPITIEALPGPGYKFVRWEGGDQLTSAKLNVDLKSNSTFTAVFEPIDWSLVSIVINEINYNSDKDTDTEDWIELYNNGPNAISLDGWYISDDDPEHKFHLPSISLNPADYLIICRDSQKFRSFYSGYPSEGDMDFGLSASGDCVRLYNEDEILTDEVCFSNKSPWPREPDGGGHTLALISPDFDNSFPRNWLSNPENGSPGSLNIFPLSSPSELLFVYPNPATDHLVIDPIIIYSESTAVRIYDQEGKLVVFLKDLALPTGKTRLTIQLPIGLKHGIYFLEIQDRQISKKARFIVK